MLGTAGWLEGEDTQGFLVDFRGDFRGDALGVARPASTDEVSSVVALCAEHGVAVLAQGGNSGLSGGSIPNVERPTVILSLTRMRTIEAVDADGFTVTADAGVTVQELQEAADAVDRLFAPDWGARGTATLGGAIATNGGGINVLRYGTTRAQVLGVEVVLADGRVWNGLRALPKDNSGYDLKQLFIASEGTLGIITRAVMRLHPKPAEHRTAFVALSDIERLNEWYALASRHRPGALSAFELIPELGVERVIERYGVQRPLPDVGEWYVLLRYSGAEDVVDQLLSLLSEGADRGLIGDAVIAESSSQEENLWRLRDELPPPRIFDGYLLKYDLAVPTSSIGAFHAEVLLLIESMVPGAMPYVFGHVGDGNLHLTVWPATSAAGSAGSAGRPAGGSDRRIDLAIRRDDQRRAWARPRTAGPHRRSEAGDRDRVDASGQGCIRSAGPPQSRQGVSRQSVTSTSRRERLALVPHWRTVS